MAKTPGALPPPQHKYRSAIERCQDEYNKKHSTDFSEPQMDIAEVLQCLRAKRDLAWSTCAAKTNTDVTQINRQQPLPTPLKKCLAPMGFGEGRRLPAAASPTPSATPTS